MHVQIILMSYPRKTYHIPSPSQEISSGPEQLRLPGELLMYICLTKPQKSRKQNGITAFLSTDPGQLTCS